MHPLIYGFYGQTCQLFEQATATAINFPDMPPDLIKEADYNAYVCTTGQNMYLFDLGHPSATDKHFCKDRNEICDVYDAVNKRFIHVKMGKSSSSISHLLRQGMFSATALRKDDEAREKFRQHLFAYRCPGTPIPDPFIPSDYMVVFACVIGENLKKDIPFFSKVSFRDAADTLRMMGYNYQFGYINKQIGATGVGADEDSVAEA